MPQFTIRPARTDDVVGIQALIQPMVDQNILLGKGLVVLYEAVQEFVVAETPDGDLVGCGALHVLWRDLGEVRTIASSPAVRGQGVGHAMLERLMVDARELGLERLFCLTFETEFFGRHGFRAVDEQVVDTETYREMLHSPDAGTAEFLDLPWVKPNTLGNTRMILRL
ncbi:amino-acid N-acetyltransferase [Gulosibacter molinativorax]|uniref:Amino-acid N-acetyltransferase n=1 Tax=Gulosibacter molinativorax TaxID=256821 RepID=A0ABT7C836_9MICO|nr:amino-acid N-acetyltransferase [Gulosibacter molinativorax]MDJ1370919.1 amino-acid N-acetyltransferase [Gulosibacter molinativorax]QUY62708.1 Amino-acid acetyltransferase [Gulosibacter molinativorax]